MKRLFSICMVFILCFTLLLGCESKANPNENEDTINDNVQETIDMQGSVFKYHIEKTLGYLENSLFADAALQRVKEVETTYNCIIERNNEQDLIAGLESALATNSYFADILKIDSYDHNAQIKNSSFYDMIEVSNLIDFKANPEKWGNKNQLSSFVWDNKLFAVIPLYYPEFFYTACDFAIFVNEQTIKNVLSQPDPREFVEKGEWTRDKFSELVNLYTYSEGQDTVYGISMYKNHFFDMNLRASGIEYAVKENDSWVSGLHTQKAVDSFNWARTFLFETHTDNILFKNTYPAIDAFINGESTMILTHVGFALAPADTASYKSIAVNVEEFGILPFPLSDDMPKNQWIGQHEYMRHGIAFPANVKNPQYNAILIDALYEPFPEYNTEELRREYYMRNIFHDDRDASIIFQMLDNSRYTYYIDGARDIVDSMANNKLKKTATEILETNKTRYQKVLESTIIPSYESINSIWGE